MIRPGMVFGVMRAESRLTRRLVRYWLFQVLALLLGVLGFVYYAFLHKFFSSWSATAGMLNPRYLLGFIGIYYLVGFLLGLVFLGFDIRARDKRERMSEVLDSLPCTNMELMLGKFLGILLPCWIPVVGVSLLLLVIGLLMGTPIEPRSLVTFSFAMAIPAYTFVLGLVFLLTVLLRHRLLASVVVIAVIVGMITINFGFVPIYLLPAVDLTGGFSVPGPSDIIPQVIESRGFTQRLGYLLAGLAMLVLAAAFHPRNDDGSRAVRAAIGVGLLVAAVAACGWVVQDALSTVGHKRDWKAAHATRKDEPVPDLVALTGDVRLRPGRGLEMELDLLLRAPSDGPLDAALFTLNPGLEVSAVRDEGGGELAFEHASGLLDVSLGSALAAGEERTLQVAMSGSPHPWFAYIDEVFDPFTMNVQEGNIFMLGFLNLIDDRRFVALMPGVRWLPVPGAEIGRGDPKQRPRDFFRVDVTVEVPEGWLVAGPGRRQETGQAGRFRFAPPGPVPEVALVAGRLESRRAEIAGVEMEVLVHPKHASNLDFFDDAAGEIRDWLTARLEEAEEIGLAYPYDAITLVEVPGALRGFAGGWRMDTTLAQPAMVLMREAGFPTARFDTPFSEPEKFQDKEGGIARAKRETLERFFENDFSGGNPFVGAARSFFAYQTAGEGPTGLPLDYVTEDLSTRLVTEKQGYFSVHHYGKDLNQTIGLLMQALFTNQSSSVSDALIQAVTSRSEVWDTVVEVSLADLDPWDAPKRTVDVLTLKGGAMSRSMLDGIGREKTGALLATLRETKQGSFFDRDDVVAAGEAIGEDLGEWIDVWVSQTDLPGFVVSDVRYERISDSEDGAARYQVAVTLRNDEPTPGLVRLEYRAGERDNPETGQSEPVSIPGQSALEIGVVASAPPRFVRVVPYLSLNRDPFNVTLPALDEEEIVDAEPFLGARAAEYEPGDDRFVLVDDLDPGFRVEEGDTSSGLRVGGRGVKDEETDQGLPIAQLGRPAPRWSRQSSGSAFGRYRHTIAVVRGGEGARKAIFEAEIPRAGQWELEYHMPRSRGGGRGRQGRSPGTWNLTIVDPSGSRDVTFDAEGGQVGWNSLGTFEIADGQTEVVVSDETDGRYVVADAIRWKPISAEATREDTREVTREVTQ